MSGKKWRVAAAAFALAAAMAGCAGQGTAVYVQPVGKLAGASVLSANDRFPGVVAAENVIEIKRDEDKTVAELLVKAGDAVEEGQELFRYDTDQLKLKLDKEKLELEQLEAKIENSQAQIAELEKERKKAAEGEKLQYTVEIQSLQVELKEAELNKSAKASEIKASEDILAHAAVVSPAAGRVQAVNENGTDSYGNPAAYITIQQTGTYRIKGSLGELQRGSLQEGSRMRIYSRMDEDQTWMGTVTLVDYESPADNSGITAMRGFVAEDATTTASKYPFYVELDSTEGLILGEHVYLSLDTGDADPAVLRLGAAFLCAEESGAFYVWADRNGRLEKRAVTVGAYDPATDTYPITEGLTEQDYIAFPEEGLCHAGAATNREAPSSAAATAAPESVVE